MNEGDPSSALELTGSIRLLVSLVAALVTAGGVSALTRLLRMQRTGLLSTENGPLPGQGLLDRAKPVLLTMTLVYLGAVCFAAGEGRVLLERVWVPLPAWGLGLGYVALFVVLVLGTLATKALAVSRPLETFRVLRGAIWIVFVVLRPITLPLGMLLDRWVPSLWALDVSPPLSGHEIRGLLADEDAAEHMDSEEVDWARSIFELRDTEIREIMVPRIDMVALDVEITFHEALPLAAASRFTRLPVYEGSPDRILGLLHTKDLLSASVRGEEPTIRDLIRPLHFLPESKPIDEALEEFRQGRIHLAVVVDEYGGTAGIVTLEDILEEIVGEIRDEFDQEGELVRVVDPQRAVIDPRIDIDDLNELLDLELPAEESDTLGGLLYQLCGRVPSRGDSVEFEQLKFTIDRVERQRIRQVTLVSDSPLGGQSSDGAEARESAK